MITSCMDRGPHFLINFYYISKKKKKNGVMFQLFGSPSKIMNTLLLQIGPPLFMLLILISQLCSLFW